MPKTLKVAIIGVGGISGAHIPGWNASGEAELVAGCDVNEAILTSWGDRHRIKKLFVDPGDVFADPDIHIVDICTPNAFHAPLVIAALKAGKHVICEKPLAPTPQEIREMIVARDEAGRMLMTAQHFRFRSSSRALKAEIESGTLGEIYHARSWMLRRAALSPKPTFTSKKLSGGGPCIDIGVHILDLTLWMMGHPKPVAVSGHSRTALAKKKGAFSVWGGGDVPSEIDVEDFAAAFVRFESGATLVLEVSWFLHHDTAGEDMQMWLYGTEAGAHWPKCEILSTNYETKQFYNCQLKLTADKTEPHALECIEFAQAVADGAEAPVPPEQALPVMSILSGLYRSQKTGDEIRID